MSVNRLVVTIEATQQSLQERLETATRHAMDPARPREVYPRTDAFLAATSRHVAAVEDVLLPVAARQVPDGHDRVRRYLHEARRLELMVARLKARLYGELHAAYLSWDEMWEHARDELARHNEMERALVDDLAASLDDEESAALAERIYRAEVKAPTRAHPYLPHRGMLGRVARRVWAVADRFWDTAESRMVPQPVRPPSKEPQHRSLMEQYLIGEPRFDHEAPVFTHRRNRG